MKKLLLTLITASLLTATVAVAQERNLLVEEGKVWTEYRPIGTNVIERRRYVMGDTVIGGVACKKLYEDYLHYFILPEGGRKISEDTKGRFVMGLTETDGRVSCYYAGVRNEPLYDFSLEAGDSLVYDKYHVMFVDRTDSILVRGTQRKRLWVTDTYYNGREAMAIYGVQDGSVDAVRRISSFWVEGVGSSTGLTEVYMWGGNTPLYLNNCMTACYKDGECIFTEQDFGVEAVATAMQPTKCAVSSPSPLYELQGRRVTSMPRRPGVYIQDGRKVVVK